MQAQELQQRTATTLLLYGFILSSNVTPHRPDSTDHVHRSHKMASSQMIATLSQHGPAGGSGRAEMFNPVPHKKLTMKNRTTVTATLAAAALFTLGTGAFASIFDTFDYTTNAEFEARYDVNTQDYTFDATGGDLDATSNATSIADGRDDFFTAVDISTAYKLDGSNPITFGFEQVRDSTDSGQAVVFLQDVNDSTNNIAIKLRHHLDNSNNAKIMELTDINTVFGTERSGGFESFGSDRTNGVWRLEIPTSGQAVWTYDGDDSGKQDFNKNVSLPSGFRSQFPDGVHVGIGQLRNGATTAIFDNLFVDGTVVPEPASLAMGLVGLGALALRRKRSA